MQEIARVSPIVMRLTVLVIAFAAYMFVTAPNAHASYVGSRTTFTGKCVIKGPIGTSTNCYGSKKGVIGRTCRVFTTYNEALYTVNRSIAVDGIHRYLVKGFGFAACRNYTILR